MVKVSWLQQYFIGNKTNIALGVFALVIVVFYGNTLLNGFVLDDRPVIQENPYVQSIRYLPKIFTGCIWEAALGGCRGLTLHYRPLHSLSYLLTWQVSSSPWFFHLVNLLQFFVGAALVFLLVKLLTKDFFVSFLTALFWIVHPVNNEVVNWNSAVAARLVVIFIVLSLIFYIKHQGEPSKKNLLLVYLFYLLAVLSKETAAYIVPALILVADLVIFRKKPADLLRRNELTRYLLFAVPFFVYFVMRAYALGGLGGLAGSENYLGGISLPDRIYYFFWLFFHYARALFYPYPLIFFHNVSLAPKFASVEFAAYVLAFIAFCALIYAIFKRGDRVLAFFLLWIFVLVLPFLVFYFVVSENYFAERYLFEPSVGFAFAFAYLFGFVWRRCARTWPSCVRLRLNLISRVPLDKTLRVVTLAVIVAIIALSWLVSFPRNKFWNDNITFIEHDLQLNPDAASMRKYLADVFKLQGDKESAKLQVEEILRRNSDWKYISHAYGALGEYHREHGDLDLALEYYKKAVESDGGRDSGNHNNIGAILMEKEEYLRAVLPLCRAVQLNPAAQESQYNFARVSSILAAMQEDALPFLYVQVKNGDVFKPAEKGGVKFKEKRCVYGECYYVFSPALAENETLLPFLVAAEAFPNELVRVNKTSFTPELGEIVLTINPQYQDRALIFIFPACSGSYYQTPVSPLTP